MKCITNEQGRALLEEIHGGVCGNHAASRTLVGKAYRAGFFWPSAKKDAENIVRTCKGCQFFARQAHVPAHDLRTIPLSWPFACWGLDLVGPLAKAPGGFEWLVVAIDKFTKWIEAQPLVNARAENLVKFFDGIVHRYGVPHEIITDLGSVFTSETFQDYCDKNLIEVHYASVAHPQANGQVEKANGLLLQGLKPRLYDPIKKYGGKWAQELPAVLWGLRTQQSRATGQSPYFLVYGSEAVLPADLLWNAPRLENYDEQVAQQERFQDIDGVEEARVAALIQNTRYLEGLRRYHQRSVQPRSFVVGDLVLRRMQKTDGLHKLMSRWEGPFLVKQIIGPGTYRLQTEEGEELPNIWNIEHLRKFYP